MFAWLFASKPVVVVERETSFSKLAIGQEFQKLGSDAKYVKTDDNEYETTDNSWHPTKWYCVHEDFLCKTCC